MKSYFLFVAFGLAIQPLRRLVHQPSSSPVNIPVTSLHRLLNGNGMVLFVNRISIAAGETLVLPHSVVRVKQEEGSCDRA